MKKVRLMSDHSGWPLWDDEGATGPEHWPMLSEELRASLQRWENYWDSHIHDERGWEPDTLAWYQGEGQRLAGELQRELGPEYSVRLNL